MRKNDPNFPNRPQHPDFWMLSKIILEMDGLGDKSDTALDSVFVDFVKTVADPRSLMYLANQRALRVDMFEAPRKTRVDALAALYLEAILVGYKLAQEKAT